MIRAVEKTHICKMAQRLEDETGFKRTFQQVKGKIKQLKQNHKKVKDNNSISGHSRKICRYFLVRIHIDSSSGTIFLLNIQKKSPPPSLLDLMCNLNAFVQVEDFHCQRITT